MLLSHGQLICGEVCGVWSYSKKTFKAKDQVAYVYTNLSSYINTYSPTLITSMLGTGEKSSQVIEISNYGGSNVIAQYSKISLTIVGNWKSAI